MIFFNIQTIASLFVLLTSAAAATASATSNATATLEKRVTHTGQGTWFYPGLGACGYTDTSSDPIVAISAQRWGTGGNCNQWIHIEDTSTGAVAYGKTRDECEGCGEEDLDLSPSLFEKFAPLSQGVIQISWHFEAFGFTPP